MELTAFARLNAEPPIPAFPSPLAFLAARAFACSSTGSAFQSRSCRDWAMGNALRPTRGNYWVPQSPAGDVSGLGDSRDARCVWGSGSTAHAHTTHNVCFEWFSRKHAGASDRVRVRVREVASQSMAFNGLHRHQ